MNTKSKKKPFFARYLETQELDEVQGGGGPLSTTKPLWDQAQTMKYPSDGDDDYPTS
ncbi:MAG: microviridin/marinostatin family tricyclic proteinase inhibitor [Nannocystaceae bacterium]